MIDVLRRSPVLHIGGGQRVLAVENPPANARTMNLSAEASISKAMKSDRRRSCSARRTVPCRKRWCLRRQGKPTPRATGELYVIGFAIQPDARRLIENCEQSIGFPAAWVQASMDLVMGDLLKNMRSSQIFAVCGLPDVQIEQAG